MPAAPGRARCDARAVHAASSPTANSDTSTAISARTSTTAPCRAGSIASRPTPAGPDRPPQRQIDDCGADGEALNQGARERHQDQNRADDQKPEGQHRTVWPIIPSPAAIPAAVLARDSAGIALATHLPVEHDRRRCKRARPPPTLPSQRRFLAPHPPRGLFLCSLFTGVPSPVILTACVAFTARQLQQRSRASCFGGLRNRCHARLCRAARGTRCSVARVGHTHCH